jgi:hypothetical protein
LRSVVMLASTSATTTSTIVVPISVSMPLAKAPGTSAAQFKHPGRRPAQGIEMPSLGGPAMMAEAF